MAAPTMADLERELLVIRELKGRLLSLDGYDRWSQDSEEEKNKARAEASEADRVLTEKSSALRQLVKETRREKPGIITDWCEAHRKLLHRLIEENPGKNRSTERFVAREEIKAWQAVANGTEDLVDQNVFYIHYDQDLYARLFGSPPL